MINGFFESELRFSVLKLDICAMLGGELNSARGWSLTMQVNIVISVLEEAHLERYKTLAQTYYWPELYNQVRSYVNSNRAQTQG